MLSVLALTSVVLLGIGKYISSILLFIILKHRSKQTNFEANQKSHKCLYSKTELLYAQTHLSFVHLLLTCSKLSRFEKRGRSERTDPTVRIERRFPSFLLLFKKKKKLLLI